MTSQLILGGTGFIGSHLAKHLAERGDDVLAIGKRPVPELNASGVQYRQLDLYACPQSVLDELLATADVVHHLAWSSFAATAETDPDQDLRANVGFTVRLLQSARLTDTRVVFCSSGGTVYGHSHEATIGEDHPLRPITAYGAGKLAAEIYADLYQRAHGLDVRVARLANPYGTGQFPGRIQGVLSRFVLQAIAGGELEIWGDGSVVRDYLHVDDAVRALSRLADAPREQVGAAPVFNIGSGHGTSLNELVSLLRGMLAIPIPVRYSPGRRIDVSHNVLSIERAATILNWRPKLSLLDGVAKLIRELKQTEL